MVQVLTPRKTDDKVKQLIKGVFGVTLWSMQEAILNSILFERYTTVRSCHAIGKSFVGGLAVPTFLILNPNSIVVTTAPTWNQVRNILWREIHKLYSRARLHHIFPNGFGGILNQTDLTLGPQWYAIGLSPKADEVERIQGFHSETGSVLILCDESPGCNPQIVDAAETSLMISPDAHMAHIGNPTDPSGHFYETFKDVKYNKFHVPFSKTPNGQAGKDIIPYLITNVWVKEMIEKWGKTHPFVINKVDANFTSKSGNSVIPLAHIERAMEEEKPPISSSAKKIMGVDVAEAGEDSSAIAYKVGEIVTKVEKYHHFDTMKICGWMIQRMKEFNPENPKAVTVNLDTIGIGKGIYDRARELGWTNVKSVRGSKLAINKNEFGNLKSEMWWTTRDALRDNQLFLPKNEELKADLVAPHFNLNSDGSILVEPKKETKKRIGRSPDMGDAVVLACAKVVPSLRIIV